MKRRALIIPLASLSIAGSAAGGAFLFSTASGFSNVIIHPKGYSGTGGTITLGVCITPGTTSLHSTPVVATDLVQPVKNAVATWNRLQPTLTNLRFSDIPFSSYDAESLILHEMGHCIGINHPNLSTESGVGTTPLFEDRNYTKTTLGADGAYDLGIGSDSVRGSRDDARDDDANLHWFRATTNDPFSMSTTVVDSTTYTRTGALPSGHSFVENADRTVAALRGHTDTEAVMQQEQPNSETQRNLGHDDVATLLLGQSGVDTTAGTSDDYTVSLVYNGISSTGTDSSIGCDITVAFGSTGFGVCSTGLTNTGSAPIADHLSITTADILITNSALITWALNTTDEADDPIKCHTEKTLTAGVWTAISLDCDATVKTVSSLFGDNLGDGNFGTTAGKTWNMFERDPSTQAYTQLTTSSVLELGKAYYIKSTTGGTIDITGEHLPANIDKALTGDAAGRFNFVGAQLWYEENWADVMYDDNGTLKTISEADPDILGVPACQTTPIPASCVVSRVAYTWDVSAYTAIDGRTAGMLGTVPGGGGVWVKVFKSGVKIRFVDDDVSIPSDPHHELPGVLAAPVIPAPSVSSAESNGLFVNSEEALSTQEWAVRLIAQSGVMKDAGNVLGQLNGSLGGWDAHDLPELAPFGSSYLNVVFPRAWQGHAGDYASDFRATGQGEWSINIRSDALRRVQLTWLGSPGSFDDDIALVDPSNSSVIRVSANGKYSFNMRRLSHGLRWVRGPRARDLLSGRNP